MKLRIIVCLLLLPAFALAQRAMRNSVEYLLEDELLNSVDASVMIYDLDDDTLLYAHRGNKLVRPASVQKVVTTVAALDILGADHMLETTLSMAADGEGCNLYVRGEMDPLFDEQDVVAMAASVPPGCVVDTLYADSSFCDSLYWGSGWVWDDNPYGFQPYLSPLMLCGGGVEVVVWPSEKGKAPSYKVVPRSSFYTVVNEAECGSPGLGKLTILRDWLEDSNVIRIKGNCEKEKRESLNMYKSADFFLSVLAEKLDSMGIEVRVLSFGKTPDGAEPIHVARRSVVDVVDEALMESDNLCAEALLYHLASVGNVPPLSAGMGCDAVRAFLTDSIGVVGDFSIADGSGLSVYDYVSADMVLGVLKYAYGKKPVFDILYNHLPLSGVSGTMQNRTKDGVAYKKVRAKTGTVKGVCTLAGYAWTADRHLCAFVILNSGLKKHSVVRKWQDRVLEAICR